jgi:DNA mismatch repair protein MutS
MSTPVRRQYLSIKRRFPDAIVLFRYGDFYEMFDEDAREAARVLQLALTSRDFGQGERSPMAGFPHHALPHYLGRLVRQGYRVAICEQLSEPGRGLVERDVVRVVTPGTLMEPGLLSPDENNYLAAALLTGNRAGLALADVSTGEFTVAQFEGPAAQEELLQELERLRPAEVLIPEGGEGALTGRFYMTRRSAFAFNLTKAREAVCQHFQVATLEGFGCAHMEVAIGAAGALLDYLRETCPQALAGLRELRPLLPSAYMAIDPDACRHLELLQNARTGELKGSLLWALDRTRTPMGGRLLRRRLLQPLLDVHAIGERLDAVQELKESPGTRRELRSLLGGIGDLERTVARVRGRSATPRELLSLAEALRTVSALRSALAEARSAPLRRLREALDPCWEVASLVRRAVSDQEGQLIRDGYHPELDALRRQAGRARRWMAELEGRERARTGIRSLKVRYNRIFGYYIEVTRPNLGLVPPDYIRKQSMAHAERFVTPELKEQEALLLHTEAQEEEMEQALYQDVLAQVAAQAGRLLATAEAIAELDVFLSMAEVAAAHGYVRPELHEGDAIEISEGRHPVVERALAMEGKSFVPNDCRLDREEQQVLILTGPNMAGKSTYLRQVALIVLMAQVGSFVPARAARIGIVDRLFTRVGAEDDIASGASTFMLEMAETARILRGATPRSLVLLDEVGRGTSTYDGMAIARAVLEHIHHRLGARTLFATHYLELASLAEELPRARNWNTAVAEEDGRLVFLYRVVPGAADRSYGVQVAQLAGLPQEVVERARELLAAMERLPPPASARAPAPAADGHDGLVGELLSLDLVNMTPLQAINKLFELQQKARSR